MFRRMCVGSATISQFHWAFKPENTRNIDIISSKSTFSSYFEKISCCSSSPIVISLHTHLSSSLFPIILAQRNCIQCNASFLWSHCSIHWSIWKFKNPVCLNSTSKILNQNNVSANFGNMKPFGWWLSNHNAGRRFIPCVQLICCCFRKTEN